MATKNIFKPILFNTEMVQAILAGRKTQTRRILKNQPLDESYKPIYYPGQRNDLRVYFRNPAGLDTPFSRFKYQIGDILWVRETFGLILSFDEFCYKADVFSPDVDKPYLGWKPSIHMPKEAARIFLKVTNVRCERLQDISEEDAIAEGLLSKTYPKSSFFFDYIRKDFSMRAKNSFQSLWDSINAKKHPWESNPWVWVYDFEVIEKPENFN